MPDSTWGEWLDLNLYTGLPRFWASSQREVKEKFHHKDRDSDTLDGWGYNPKIHIGENEVPTCERYRVLSGDSTHTRMVVGPCNLVDDQKAKGERHPKVGVGNRFLKNTQVQIASAQKSRGTEDAIINVRPISEIWRCLRSTKPFCCGVFGQEKRWWIPFSSQAKTRVIRFPSTITLQDLECHTKFLFHKSHKPSETRKHWIFMSHKSIHIGYNHP